MNHCYTTVNKNNNKKECFVQKKFQNDVKRLSVYIGDYVNDTLKDKKKVVVDQN